ncbi:MAG: hypothetical protein ACK5RJ_03355, partial [Burkholderiales bacterium]
AGDLQVRFDERDVETGLWLAIEAPSDERDGNRYAKPTATAPHPDSTRLGGSRRKKAVIPQTLSWAKVTYDIRICAERTAA